MNEVHVGDIASALGVVLGCPGSRFLHLRVGAFFFGLGARGCNLFSRRLEVLHLLGALLGVVPQQCGEDEQTRQQCGAHPEQGGRRGTAASPFQGPLAPAGRPGKDRLLGKIAFQVLRQGQGAGIALRRGLFEAFQADGFQVAWDARVQRPWVVRLPVENLQDRVEGRRGAEGWFPREAGVKDGAETVDIHGRREVLLGGGLFGGHVLRGADNGPSARQFIAARAGGFRRAERLGQAEIGDVRLAGGVHQDVRRFDVAMEDAALVGVMHRPRDQRHEASRFSRSVAQSGEGSGQAAALNELHCEVVLTLMFADLVDRDNVGMVEQGGGLGFSAEAPDIGGGGQLSGKDDLQRDDAVGVDLSGLVNQAHAAPAQFLQHLVAGQVDVPPAAGRGTERHWSEGQSFRSAGSGVQTGRCVIRERSVAGGRLRHNLFSCVGEGNSCRQDRLLG